MQKVRLGPLAVFLAIVTIVLTMMSLLSFATAEADARLAERYADTVHIKYRLESEAAQFKHMLDKTLAEGDDPTHLPGVTEKTEDVYVFTAKAEDYTLTLEFQLADEEADFLRRKITKDWAETDLMENLWMR